MKNHVATTEESPITCIEFCAGYGGIYLGLKRVIPTLRTIALCERELYAVGNLSAKMEAGLLEPVPIWTDVKTFPSRRFRGLVDILVGGYPCGPFSAAGKRLGSDDPRHIYPFISNAIRDMRPRYVFFENVDGHISLGLREVLTDLVKLGYRVENSRGEPTWGVFSASEVGAPHQRKRVFILGVLGVPTSVGRGEGRAKPERFQGGLSVTESGDAPSELADAGSLGSSVRLSAPEGFSGEPNDRGYQDRWPARPGEQQHSWEPPRVLERRLGRNFDGTSSGLDQGGDPHRVDRLRLLGNGVVPATVARAWTVLFERSLK